jgi:hypothetical protein
LFGLTKKSVLVNAEYLALLILLREKVIQNLPKNAKLVMLLIQIKTMKLLRIQDKAKFAESGLTVG